MFLPLPDTKFRRRVFLMRHGEVSYFNDDGTPVTEPNLVSLTSKGRAQAERMRDMLKDVSIDKAVCSGVLRAEQTASLVLGDRDIEIGGVGELREIQPKSYASVPENSREDDLVYAFENADKDNFQYANGEFFTEFAKRIENAFRNILAQDDWTSLLIVSHDGVNRLLLSMAASGFRTEAREALRNMGGVDQDPCCINIVDIDVVDGEIRLSRIKSVNLTPDNAVKKDNHLTSMEKVFKPYAKSYIDQVDA